MQLAFDYDQRWADRREVRRLPDVRMRPQEFGVDDVSETLARAFVTTNHYSGSFPASHCTVGLFRKTGVHPAVLAGVAVFSEGIQSGKGMPRWTGFPASEGTELGRFVLSPDVAYNGESWFLRRAFGVLRCKKPRTRAVLSYSDPMERKTSRGQIVKPGHYGTIYQASNALYLGRASSRSRLIATDGRVLEEYNLYKVRRLSKGWRAAERIITDLTGVEREDGEETEAWLARATASLRRMRHPGNLTYAFGLDDDAWRTIRACSPPHPYPKKDDMDPATGLRSAVVSKEGST